MDPLLVQRRLVVLLLALLMVPTLPPLVQYGVAASPEWRWSKSGLIEIANGTAPHQWLLLTMEVAEEPSVVELVD